MEDLDIHIHQNQLLVLVADLVLDYSTRCLQFLNTTIWNVYQGCCAKLPQALHQGPLITSRAMIKGVVIHWSGRIFCVQLYEYRMNIVLCFELIVWYSSLLTALYIGESSPLISFGKSALTGYTNRGNPSVCYRDYPKCPRNNADLVNYLNNHNGGFFRFFGNNGGQGSQGEYYRGALRREPAPSPGFARPQTVRTGTGELKFDHTASLYNQDFAQSFFPDRKEQNESNKITFPQERLQEEQFINRLSKSLLGHEETVNGSPLYHQVNWFTLSEILLSQIRKLPCQLIFTNHLPLFILGQKGSRSQHLVRFDTGSSRSSDSALFSDVGITEGETLFHR